MSDFKKVKCDKCNGTGFTGKNEPPEMNRAYCGAPGCKDGLMTAPGDVAKPAPDPNPEHPKPQDDPPPPNTVGN
jgi:hypothetical protein